MESDPSFGRWLQQRRRALDLTQAELAGSVGYAANHLRNIEADRRRPSRLIAERLATCLSVESAERAALVAFARGHTAPPHAASPDPPPGSTAAVPPEPRAAARLPMSPAPLLGRERELADLRALLLQEHVRLLTLTGPGGTGKTRLAIAVAHDLEDAFPNGARFVALGSLADAALVPATVAAALGVTAAQERALDERLVAFFATKRLLLVLDNLEHLPAAVPWIAMLLQRCPTLTLLVTSRAVLHLSHEQVYPVPPLALPEVVQHNGRLRNPPPEQLRHNAAVRRFAANVDERDLAHLRRPPVRGERGRARPSAPAASNGSASLGRIVPLVPCLLHQPQRRCLDASCWLDTACCRRLRCVG